MGFRFAGFRPAALRAAAVLILALGANAALAQSAPAKTATVAQPAAAATQAALAAAPAAAPAPAPVEATAATGNAAAGQAKAAVCGACHGVDGNSSDPQYPKLAGQSEQYIVRQLENFKSGKRQNPIMLGMATPLSEQDMHDIAAYFASKTPLPGVADQALVERGQKLFREGDVKRGIPACMACHSIDGRGNPGAQYPQLESQHAQYVEAVLKAWHNGDAWGTDAHSQIMPAIAKKLDANDIAAVASYIEGLHPATATDLAKPAAH
jgi:cytochrome c553